MAKIAAEENQDAMNSTQRHLDEMQLRVAEHDLPGGPADRELTEMKQRQIVERASAILFEKGFHGTSIRDIATACDMSMGQLYHYISSKDDILFLMHLTSQEQWHRCLAEGGFDQITDPVAKLEHGLRLSIKFLSQNRDLFQFLYTESKYMDREHLRKALELDDRNVIGFYRHLLAEIPGRPCDGARPRTGGQHRRLPVHLPGPAWLEPGPVRRGRGRRGRGVPCRLHSSAGSASSADRRLEEAASC